MLTMHPTVLVGPADWQPARMPKEEFLGRIAAFFAACDPAIAGAIVYGDPRSHGALAWLTHLTPKLEACIALIPRHGEPRLLVGGGANMIGAAKPLTWIETLAPLREAGATVARWRDEMNGALALVNGDAAPLRLRLGIEAALGVPPADATGTIAEEMRRKSPRELALVREACAGLQAAIWAMRVAQRAGKSVHEVVLTGERAAWRRGAQDVRSLCGRDGRLAPLMLRDDAPADPVHVYVAVRHGGYWADGFAVLSRRPQPVQNDAQAVLDAAVTGMRPGLSYREVVRSLGQSIGTRRAHEVTQADFGHQIGLALQEPGTLNETSPAVCAAGDVYTVRVGLRDVDRSALVSAMVLITEDGHEMLWGGTDA